MEDNLLLNVESMLEDIKNSLPTEEVKQDQNLNTNQSSNYSSSRPLTPVFQTKACWLNNF